MTLQNIGVINAELATKTVNAKIKWRRPNIPKDGYVSVTFPTWILEAASVIMPPGQTLQAFILNNLLVPNISKKQLRDIYDKWVSQYYPYGGTKPLETQESKNEN